MDSSLFELYLSRSDLRESSIEIKRRAFRFFQDYFAELPLDRISYAVVEDFRTLLTKGRSRTSANIYLQNIKPFFGWLVKRGYTNIDPFAGLAMYRIEKKRRPTYDSLEIERIMRVANQCWQVIVLLKLVSGLRRAEVLNLVVRDIHYDQRYILVSPKLETAETWLWLIKEHRQEIVPLPETVELPNMIVKFHDLLIRLSESLEKQPYVVLPAKYYHRNLKRREEGKLTYEDRLCPWPNFNRAFNSLLRRAKVNHKRPHDLRATCATTLSKHLSLTETQRLMRHASPQTTAKYYIRHDEEKLVQKASEITKKYYASNVT